MRAAMVADVLRAPDFTGRLTFGLAARWDLSFAKDGPSDVRHRVAPVTLGAAGLHLESRDGLTLLDVGVEGGLAWSSRDGFGPTAAVALSAERVLLAVNDLPFSIFAEGAWEDGRGARLVAGLRVGVLR